MSVINAVPSLKNVIRESFIIWGWEGLLSGAGKYCPVYQVDSSNHIPRLCVVGKAGIFKVAIIQWAESTTDCDYNNYNLLHSDLLPIKTNHHSLLQTKSRHFSNKNLLSGGQLENLILILKQTRIPNDPYNNYMGIFKIAISAVPCCLRTAAAVVVVLRGSDRLTRCVLLHPMGRSFITLLPATTTSAFIQALFQVEQRCRKGVFPPNSIILLFILI